MVGEGEHRHTSQTGTSDDGSNVLETGRKRQFVTRRRIIPSGVTGWLPHGMGG